MGGDMHDAVGFLIKWIDHLQSAVTRADRLLDAVAVSTQSLDDGFGFVLGAVERIKLSSACGQGREIF